MASDITELTYVCGGDNASLNGIVSLNVVSGAVKALMGGAANNTAGVGGVNMVVRDDGQADLIYGAGRGNVSGGVSVEIATSRSISGPVYGGAVLLATATGDLAIGGDVTLNISGGSFGGDIVGGNRVNGGTAGTGIISGTVGVNVNGGELAASRSVYGGGFAVSNGATALEIDVQGGVEINWTGGTMAGEATNGRGIFGGALAANNATAQTASAAIDVTGGTVTNIFGGGWAQSGGQTNITGDVNITVSGADTVVANIFGGGAHALGEAGTTSVGNVTISVSGGAINKIYATGQQDGDEITGVANVVFTGASDFSTMVSGAGYQGANADATAYLTFDSYTGSFTGSVANFDAVKVNGSTAASLTGAEIANNAWIFDLTDNAGTATMLDWNDAELSGDTVQLEISSINRQNWSLIAGAAGTNYAAAIYTLSIDGKTATTLAYDTVITDGAFEGYKLYDSVDSETGVKTLMFGIAG